MFDKSFQTLYTWETQNLQLKMDVLQCNIVQQMLFILEGSVPQTKVEQPEVEMSVHESIDGKNINSSHELRLKTLKHMLKLSYPIPKSRRKRRREASRSK